MQPGDSSHSLSFSELVFSDLKRLRPGAKPSWTAVLLRAPSVPGILASVVLRAQQCLFRSGHARLASCLTAIGVSIVGADLGPGSVVGTGFAMVHPVGVTMGYGARIGNNVTFAGGVVLAARYYDGASGEDQSFPVIDDGATIGAHAVLVGGVHIGKNAMVGANSVVVSDVEENAVVMGNPARRVASRTPEPVVGTAR